MKKAMCVMRIYKLQIFSNSRFLDNDYEKNVAFLAMIFLTSWNMKYTIFILIHVLPGVINPLHKQQVIMR